MKHATTVVLLFITLIGCSKDPVASSQGNSLSTKGVYILNEGGYTKSNSSLSFFLPDSHQLYSDVFFAANKRPLGDVANDIVLFGNKAFIVLNNSDKIEIISTDTHASLGTINLPGDNPNKIVIFNSSKGYITNQYKGTVTAFNPTTYGILKQNISVGLNPQGMVVANGKVFVCNSGYGSDSTVSVIDPAVDSVVATITVAKSPTDIAVDSDGDIVVVCNGFTDYSGAGKDTPVNVTFIDPSTLAVKATIELSLGQYGHPGELALSDKGYGFTIVQYGVIKFNTKTHSLISPNFILRSAYSIAVDNVTDRIYLGDAKNYSTPGMVYVHEKDATTVDSISVGIIPGTIVFKR
ncbi:MAG: DUF5074 domain-containing protein [Bacteroidota bacterium]